MGVIIRQSILSTIIAYVGVTIGYLNLLYLYPKFLSPEQVGLMRAMQDSAILMAQFAQFGLAQTIIRFFPRFVGQQDRSTSFINLIIICAIGLFGAFLLVFLLFETQIRSYFAENAADLIHYMGLALWFTFVTVLMTLLEVYSRSLLKNLLPNILREIVMRLFLALLALLYFSEILSFHQVMVGSVLTYLFCFLVLVFSLFKEGHLKFHMDLSMLDRTLWKEMVRFCLLSFAGTAGLIIIGKVDSLMVAGLLGLAPVAIYTNSFYMATVIEVPKRAMTQVATPLIARGFEKNDMQEIIKIYHKTSLNQFLIGSLLLLGIVANLDSIFFLMPRGEIYEAGRWVVIIVGIGKLVDMLFGPSSEIIIYSRYYWFNIILILMLAASLVTANNLLIPRYGINGAAIGAAGTLILFNVVKFLFIWARIEIQPFSMAFIKVILIALVSGGVSLAIPRFDFVFADIFVRSAVITLVFGALTLWSKVSPEANSVFMKGLALAGVQKKESK